MKYYKGYVEEICHFKIESKRDLEIRLSDNCEVPTFIEEFGDFITEEKVNEKLKDFIRNNRYIRPNEKEESLPSVCPSGNMDNYTWSGGPK